ncbi:cupin domain-containing protein [Microvirga antarctica]|uniref:cupin domain-containing protein n=1 Tax=Microvirga antarctica TaxID=2819233 RepID=UPI001FE5AEF0|nr:cupin domain-containing protein [Microvirga antarctica]
MPVATINWNEIPWTPVREGVERKGFTGEGATVALHRLMPGHEPKPHSHIHEQIAYIISGTIRFHVGEEVHLITGGGLIVIPPNVVHWGEVVGDEPVINLDVFTPQRPEYA